MDYNYPLLQKVFGYFKNIPHDVNDYYLVCCQHLLEPQLKMFEYLVDFGFNPNKIIVLGKIYSTNTSILKELKDKGIKVFQPEFSGKAFDIEHKNNCNMILDLVPKDKKIVILDDGAELIMTFADNKRDVLFAVEQTSSGFRKIENKKMNFPVVNVARSETKLIQESPFIARDCFEKIKNYFQVKNIKNPSIFVVGLGPIGEAMQKILEQNDFKIQGFDVKYGHNNLIKNILNIKPDVIIGATGFPVLLKKDIEKISSLNKQLYLISVSSADREFPVADFRKDKEIHKDVVNKNVIFVNNGFPINFQGNSIEGMSADMEKTICLLSGSVIYGVTHILKNKGLVDIPIELENLIN